MTDSGVPTSGAVPQPHVNLFQATTNSQQAESEFEEGFISVSTSPIYDHVPSTDTVPADSPINGGRPDSPYPFPTFTSRRTSSHSLASESLAEDYPPSTLGIAGPKEGSSEDFTYTPNPPVLFAPTWRDLYMENTTSTPKAKTPVRQQANNALDDVFDPGPSPTYSEQVREALLMVAPISTSDSAYKNYRTNSSGPSGFDEPSEVPRLQSAHSTAGYREGLAAAKNNSVQGGFDEGYSLGAAMGLKIGGIIGALEGIAFALDESQYWDTKNKVTVPVVERERVKLLALMEEARKEMRTEIIFGAAYWSNDGTWRYEVEGDDGEKGITWETVADEHPLVKKWEGKLEEVAQRFSLGLMGLEDEPEELDETGATEQKETDTFKGKGKDTRTGQNNEATDW